MQLELCKEFTFEASHVLPKHPGKCSRLHGHSWKLRVYVKGVIDPDTGFVMDYAILKSLVQPIVDSLDHRHLGAWKSRDKLQGFVNIQIEGDHEVWGVKGLGNEFYPSSENLILWIAKQVDIVPWSRLELDETCTSRCILTREEYDATVRT